MHTLDERVLETEVIRNRAGERLNYAFVYVLKEVGFLVVFCKLLLGGQLPTLWVSHRVILGFQLILARSCQIKTMP